MINGIYGNCGNRTVVKHCMMSCCLLCATTSILDFLLAMTVQSFCLSQSIPVTASSIGLVSLESQSWS